MATMQHVRKGLRRFFVDKRGKVVLLQAPNLALWIWILTTLASKVLRPENKTVTTSLSVLGRSALIVWAIMEITQGATYFRRLVGLIILLFTMGTWLLR